MRLTIACVLVALLPLAPSAATPPRPSVEVRPATRIAPKECVRHGPRVASSGQVRIFRHPSEFPPSDLHHAIHRRVDNCPVPAIVRRNVGQ